MERLAWSETLETGNRLYGLNLDPTTNGFAAAPTVRSAREHALNEARERWNVVEWWKGSLDHTISFRNGLQIIKILSPTPGTTVITCTEAENVMTFGYAHAAHEQTAIAKAKIELERNKVVLAKTKLSYTDLPPGADRRLLFYSLGPGRDIFKLRCQENRSANIDTRLVVDCYVPGRWQRAAHVWRCLYDHTDWSHLNWDNDFFLF